MQKASKIFLSKLGESNLDVEENIFFETVFSNLFEDIINLHNGLGCYYDPYISFCFF